MTEFCYFDPPPPKKVSTCCKHKRGACELCGTSDEMDVVHETIEGIGKVGRLMSQKKKRKKA